MRPRANSAALLLSLALTGCPKATSLVTLMPGVLNDPANRTLRRDLLSFGSAEFCKELLKRGMPLKLRDDAPSIGRFFADQCDYKELENGDAFVQFSGYGYAYTEASARVGFRSGAAVRYNPDFLLEGSSMYAYFRPRNVQSSAFQSVMIERAASNPLTPLLGGAPQEIANRIGAQIAGQEVQKGFTVIRDDDGSVDFGLGIIEKGKRPFHPFATKSGDKVTLANDWTEVQTEQRDFVGPFEVTDSGQALHVTLAVDGAPALDFMVVNRSMGEFWVRQYSSQVGTTGLPGQVVFGDVAQGKTQVARAIRLPKGSYFLVLDHSSTAGPTAPPAAQTSILGGTNMPAVVRYVVQLGDAP